MAQLLLFSILNICCHPLVQMPQVCPLLTTLLSKSDCLLNSKADYIFSQGIRDVARAKVGKACFKISLSAKIEHKMDILGQKHVNSLICLNILT